MRGVITGLGLQVLTLRLCSEGLDPSGRAGSGQAEKNPKWPGYTTMKD